MSPVADPKRWEKQKHFPPWLGLVAVLAIGFLATMWGVLWVAFAEHGSGETRESPDGHYDASAFNKSQGRLDGTRLEWDEFRLTEKKSGREVWAVKRFPPPGTSPDYGLRGMKFIEWAADSSAVTIDIGGGQKLTFPVP
ncbi:MAG: hypothetical protein ACOVT5_07305 [Armatimonadaceae bacterium]